MTAKEQLRERVEQLTEEEAAATLELLDQRTDAHVRWLDDAPLDDEPTTPEEESAVREALQAAGRGETISLEELRGELDADSGERAAALARRTHASRRARPQATRPVSP